MTVFFAKELETVATFWRIFRADGLAFGFTTHDRALYFEGVRHLSAPGMIPSAIRRTNDLSPDSAEVEGALSHDAITATDLANGLFDEATIEIGAVEWQTLESVTLYTGELGSVSGDRDRFSAELRSAKTLLEREIVPRTSPTCRARFCGPGCGLSASRFTTRTAAISTDPDTNRVRVGIANHADYLDGVLRFLEGPQIGLEFGIVATDPVGGFLLDRPVAADTPQEAWIELRQGCDHRLITCEARFGNALNFRGEPYLPGNDLLARYPRPQ